MTNDEKIQRILAILAEYELCGKTYPYETIREIEDTIINDGEGE